MLGWLKRSAALVALKKMKPLNRALMVVFVIIALIYAILAYAPGWVTTFL